MGVERALAGIFLLCYLSVRLSLYVCTSSFHFVLESLYTLSQRPPPHLSPSIIFFRHTCTHLKEPKLVWLRDGLGLEVRDISAVVRACPTVLRYIKPCARVCVCESNVSVCRVLSAPLWEKQQSPKNTGGGNLQPRRSQVQEEKKRRVTD